MAIRRVISWVAMGLAAGALAAGWLFSGAWVVGRTASDRWLWSQFVSWIPAEVLVLGSAAGLGAGVGLARLARRMTQRDGAAGRSGAAGGIGRLATWGLAAACVGIAAHVALVGWRLPNALTRESRSAGPPQAVRVAFWNLSDVPGPQSARALFEDRAEVVVLVNAWMGGDWHALVERMGGWDESAGRWARPVYPVWIGTTLVVSRFPVLEWAGGPLGITPRGDDPRLTEQRRRWIDLGFGAYVRLGTEGALGREMVLWIVDLPSDPRLHRERVTREASASIASYGGARSRASASGWEPVEGAAPGFPQADVIVGDFNIPRGARSLRHLTAGLTHAFDAAGVGYVATFPRRQADAPGAEGSPVARLWIAWSYRTGLPLLHIDHAFVARWLRVRRYEAPDGGAGSHHWQLVELEARGVATGRGRVAR